MSEELEELKYIYRHKIKLKPKEQWYCDSCGEIISSASDGWFEWYNERGTLKEGGYRIVHHDERCMYDVSRMFSQGKSVSDMHLDDYVGDEGLVHLTFELEKENLIDRNEVIEMIRRLHIPYYEEARRHWDRAEDDYFFDGANEVWPYLPETSLRIIGKYSDG